ncbi:MAG TPA: 23S rRNA (pseudouridine(1915)-N(3))-methyltransferase RlmH [Bacilli bacterium]
MHIQVVAVGKIKEAFIERGIAEYAKRLTPYTKLEIVEVPDDKAPENLSEAEEQAVKAKEGERILANVHPDAFMIALAIDGELWTSEQLSGKIDDLATYGTSRIAFVIGGSLGLSPEVLARADKKLSFGRLTFPHQIMRLILVEQIYRAFKIMRGEPYHR